ncbi:MAG: GNAT family N-acetyltransferase [Ilumatobacteraceae bacterium]
MTDAPGTERVPEPIVFDRIAPDHPDAIAAMTRYYTELDTRFADGFDTAAALGLDVAAMGPPNGAFVVARQGDSIVACGGVQRIADGVAEIKRMWVDPRRRGIGLGRRMLDRLEETAFELGHRVIRLDTNSVLTEAISLYERSGYRSIERYNDNPDAMRWFEKSLMST